MNHVERLISRYQDLQAYVGWTPDDAQRVQAAAPVVTPFFAALVDDFYAEIDRHAAAREVITGGTEQVERLKRTLVRWLEELFSGSYDEAYVRRRWQVGLRHVEIGLDQVYANMALARLRSGLVRALEQRARDQLPDLRLTISSLHKLLDLDLAIIEDAYQTEYRDRLQRGERLATIGQVAGGIAHELRNPLNVVKTSVYYLLHARSATPEKMTEHLRRIERQVGLADGVITALADFSRLPIPELRPVSLQRCLEETLEQNPLPRQIQVKLDLPSPIPEVLGDMNQLRIVFGNLIRNARDAMPEGGQLTIAARQGLPQVQVSITDTGAGIRPEDLGRIMEPLYSTKAHGLGLGLAITRAILDKHQGALHVASELGKGATFTVRLPAALNP